MQTYIFAYGSLMNPRSLARTLPGDRATRCATLKGYRRRMNLPYNGYAYLNIVPEDGSSVQGVLIPVNEMEFELFTSREEGYERVDVTRQLEERPEGTAFAFIAPNAECGLKVPRSYIRTCTSEMTPEECEQWIAETVMGEIEEDLDNPVYDFAA